MIGNAPLQKRTYVSTGYILDLPPPKQQKSQENRDFPSKNVSLPGANRYKVKVRSTVEETQPTPKAKSGEERAAEVSSALSHSSKAIQGSWRNEI